MIEGTIDCQEAHSRFGKYLAGTESGEAAIELESHLDQCFDCRMAFEHRRESQTAMKERERAAIDFERISQEAEAVQTRSIASALRKQSLQQMLRNTVEEVRDQGEPATVIEPETSPEPAAIEQPEALEPNPIVVAKPRRQLKSVVYTVALVTVLAAAILVSANSGSIFESPSVKRDPGSVEAAIQSTAPPQMSMPIVPITSSPMNVPAPVDEPIAPTEGQVVGETVGSDAGLTIATAKPIEEETLAPVRRKVSGKKSVRRKATRRGPARRTSAPRQGVRVYNP